MWTSKKSATLTLVFIYIFMIVFVALELLAPLAVKGFILWYAKGENLLLPLTVFLYSVLLPVGYALILLRKILKAVLSEQCFCEENVLRLRRLSWCCFVFAVCSFGFGFAYFPLMLLSAAAAFVGLIVRVIKNAFQTALELQNENQLTI
jgi:hypothetical protein